MTRSSGSAHATLLAGIIEGVGGRGYAEEAAARVLAPLSLSDAIHAANAATHSVTVIVSGCLLLSSELPPITQRNHSVHLIGTHSNATINAANSFGIIRLGTSVTMSVSGISFVRGGASAFPLVRLLPH